VRGGRIRRGLQNSHLCIYNVLIELRAGDGVRGGRSRREEVYRRASSVYILFS